MILEDCCHGQFMESWMVVSSFRFFCGAFCGASPLDQYALSEHLWSTSWGGKGPTAMYLTIGMSTRIFYLSSYRFPCVFYRSGGGSSVEQPGSMPEALMRFSGLGPFLLFVQFSRISSGVISFPFVSWNLCWWVLLSLIFACILRLQYLQIDYQAVICLVTILQVTNFAWLTAWDWQ